MSFHGRSPDDLPLAAYTTGVAPDDEGVDELPPDPGYESVPAASASTAELQAKAHAHAADAAADPASAPARKRGLSIRLPHLGRGKQLAAGAPFKPAAAAARQAAVLPPTPAFQAAVPFEAVRPDMAPPPARPGRAKAASGATVARAPRLAAPDIRLPRELLRDRRVLAGGTIAIGLAILGVSLLGGGGPTSGSSGPNGSQGTGAAATPMLGTASVELTGGERGTFNLTGATGAGPAVDSHLDATWTDPAGQTLGLTGLASQGTRTTDPSFVLRWTMLVDGVVTTFTSQAKECTVGMAVGVKAVHGSFVCKKLASPDGKVLIDLHGDYTT